MNRRERRGIVCHNAIENENFAKMRLERFFESVEPYFKAILEENRRLTLSEKNTFHGLFEHINGHTEANIYDMMMNQFEQRIKTGFEYSINVLKQYPVDETFTQHVKDELDRFAYAKDVLLFVFESMTFGPSKGSSESIERYINNNWDRDYYDLLKERIELPQDAHALFAHLNQN